MWVTVRTAARDLGISENAVRNRIKRGTLGAERRDGRVYVSIADDARPSGPAEHLVDDQPHGQLAAEIGRLQTAARQANRDYEDLAEAWARDLRRQIGRLEHQIDGLNSELQAERARAERLADNYSEEIRRLTTLLQTAQQRIGDLTNKLALPAPAEAALQNARTSGRAEAQAEVKDVLAALVEMLRRR